MINWAQVSGSVNYVLDGSFSLAALGYPNGLALSFGPAINAAGDIQGSFGPLNQLPTNNQIGNGNFNQQTQFITFTAYLPADPVFTRTGNISIETTTLFTFVGYVWSEQPSPAALAPVSNPVSMAGTYTAVATTVTRTGPLPQRPGGPPEPPGKTTYATRNLPSGGWV